MNKRVIRVCLIVVVGFLPLSNLAAENQDVIHGRKTSVEEKVNQYIRSLPGPGKTVLTSLKRDLFGCDQGFLIFHRYGDGKIQDFNFNAQNIDDFADFFIKKRLLQNE